MRIQIFHNLLWSSYKGAVFSCLYREASASKYEIRFVHVAETDSDRASLTAVDLTFHQYPYVLLFRGNYYGVSAISRAVAAAREQRRVQADCIVINSYDDLLAWVLLFLGKLRKQRLIVSLDSTYFDHRRVWYKEFVKKIFISQCDWAFCYGSRSKQYLQFLGMDEHRISIRCQAAPSERILKIRDELDDNGSWRQPLMNQRPYFLFVGRLASEKGLRTLLAAFSKLTSNCNFDLLIAGAGPLGEKLRRESAVLPRAERVRFLGPRALRDLVILYRDAFFLVLPSTSEPWGLVVNEAFTLGCPAIVSDVCGCAPDLITSETGFMFETDSESELIHAMQQASLAESRRDRMGEAARKLVESYNPLAAAKQMLTGIDACFASQPSQRGEAPV